MNGHYSIYVMECEDGKYYVGKSLDADSRIDAHMNQEGSAWTRRHRALHGEVVEIVQGKEESSLAETSLTLQYMAKYGIDNVRGGRWVRLTLSDEAISELEKQMAHLSDSCFACGKSGHFVSACPTRKRKASSKATTAVSKGKGPARNSASRTGAAAASSTTTIVTTVTTTTTTEAVIVEEAVNVPKGLEGVTCYTCGQTGHYANRCNGSRKSQPAPQPAQPAKVVKTVVKKTSTTANAGRAAAAANGRGRGRGHAAQSPPDVPAAPPGSKGRGRGGTTKGTTSGTRKRAASGPAAAKRPAKRARREAPSPSCRRCGRDHPTESCYAKSDIDGRPIPDESDESEEEYSDDSGGDVCFRCGRDTHWAQDCYAKRDIDGRFIRD